MGYYYYLRHMHEQRFALHYGADFATTKNAKPICGRIIGRCAAKERRIFGI